jgi:hypothetical protein
MGTFQRRAFDLLTSPKAKVAFDLSREDRRVVERFRNRSIHPVRPQRPAAGRHRHVRLGADCANFAKEFFDAQAGHAPVQQDRIGPVLFVHL